MKVFKFGGASVKDAFAVKNVASILSLFEGEKLTVIVSAMGKTTNKLENVVNSLKNQNRKEFAELIEELELFHEEILAALFPEKHFSIYNTIETIFDQLKDKINKPFSENTSFEYDQIVSLGEVISSHIVAAFLTEQRFSARWMDARQLVRTDTNYQEGKVDWLKTELLIQSKFLPEFSNSNILVTQGFLGHTPEGFTTTLGREGSDYSAGIFAYCGNAESVTIWKDVPGMLNADPKYFEDTIKLDKISFKEAIELSYYGASVIHPKTIKPLQNKGIPLFVKSFNEPLAEGTIIQSSTSNDELVPSFIFKKEQTLYSFTPKDFSFIVEENLSDIFNQLSLAKAKINLMQNSALSFSILVDSQITSPATILNLFSTNYEVRYNESLELVTVRHYDDLTIERVTKNKEIILQQRTRHTARFVLKSK